GEASMWATYYLRASKLWVGDFEGLLGLPFIRPLLNLNSPAAPPGLRYLLTTAVDPGPVTEDEGWTLVWQSGEYRLWDVGDTGWSKSTGRHSSGSATVRRSSRYSRIALVRSP